MGSKQLPPGDYRRHRLKTALVPCLLRGRPSAVLGNSCQTGSVGLMTTMNISLPEELKAFVDSQVESGAYSSTSEYVREVLRREQDRAQLRQLLLDGAASPDDGPMDAEFFADLRRSIAAAR